MKLFGYFRSSAAYRVRIALNLKGLDYELVPLHLQKNEHLSADYARLNPQQLLPSLEVDGAVLTQSLAIIEYLDEVYPKPALLPKEPVLRAQVRAMAQAIACDIHPINNLRVLRYLVHDMGLSDENKNQWYRHWVESGLAAVEQMLRQSSLSGDFCFGAAPGLADACLVPQVANGRRFNCDLSGCPTVVRIVDHCNTLDAFRRAAPDQQPDAE